MRQISTRSLASRLSSVSPPIFTTEYTMIRKSGFANSDKEDAIRNQYELFTQRMGGPPLFSQRRGHPALIARHRPFPVTRPAAERWLHHMQHALDTSNDIDTDSKTKMMNFS